MSERPGTENQETDTSEPLYTRAEVEIMINEMLAAKLAELENAFPTHVQPSVPSLASKKGKEPEIFVPWLREQDILYHKGLLENIRPTEEVFNVSYASEIGESSVESESEFLRKEIAKMNTRGQAYNDFGENTNKESRVTSPKAMYKPFDFNGDSDPMVYLDQCELTAETNGLPANLMADWFSSSLQGPALNWYLSLEEEVKSDWARLSHAFLKQFTPEARKSISMDELKAVTQNLNEPFSDYLNRWWNKLMLVRNKPDEQGLIRVFLSGTLPTFRKEMYFLPYDDFMDVRQVGMDIERRIWLEALQVENDEDHSGPALKTKRTSGPQINVKPSGKFQGQGGSRKFTDLGMSLSRMMEELIKKGLLQPLEPKPLPDPVPGYFDLQCYCDFHQSKGHHTNGCKRLRHEIQDLIDQGKVRDPSTGRFRNPK